MTMKNPPHPGGVVLRQCIKPLALTITDAAEALGVTRNTLSELVNEKRAFPLNGREVVESFWRHRRRLAQYDLAQVHRARIKLKRLRPALPRP